MRISDNILINNMVDNIQNNLSELSRVNQQVSTGKAIQNPSEDPVRASKSLGFETQIQNLEQFKKNSDEALGWMNVTLSHLGDFREIINSARTETLKSATDTSSPESRLASAKIIDSLKTQLMSVANAKWQGQQIFAGSKTTTNPYSTYGQYSGDATQISRTIAPGESVIVNYDGQKVFQGGADIFQTLNNLSTAFQNNDTAAMQTGLQNLDSSLNNVLQLEAVMGSESQRVESTKTRIDDMKLTLTDLQSKNDNVDVAETLIRYQTLQNAYQASLTASNQLLQQSLLRFLK